MYKKMYLRLFNAVSDSLTAMEQMNYGEARRLLMQAQQACEELFLDGEEEKPSLR